MKNTLAAFIALGLASAASATPTIQSTAPDGFRVADPKAAMTESGLEISGAVCRAKRAALKVNKVTIEQIGSAGTILNTATARLIGAKGQRSMGCAFYAVDTTWTLNATDTIRVTAIR